MVEVRERKTWEDNSYMLKRLASHNPSMYDGVPNTKAFFYWIRGMEKLFETLQFPEECRIGLAVFYLKDEADLW